MDYVLRTQQTSLNPAMTRIMGSIEGNKDQSNFQVQGMEYHESTTTPMEPPKKQYDYQFKPGFRPVWDKSSYSQPKWQQKYNLPKREPSMYYQPEMWDQTQYSKIEYQAIPHNPEMPQSYLLFEN